MEKMIRVSIINPCFGCMAYDPDIGCTIPLSDHWYACPLVFDPYPDPYDLIKSEESEENKNE